MISMSRAKIEIMVSNILNRNVGVERLYSYIAVTTLSPFDQSQYSFSKQIANSFYVILSANIINSFDVDEYTR